MTQESKNRLVEVLREVNFGLLLKDYVDCRIPNVFYNAKTKGMTLDQYVNEVEDDREQHTVYLTPRISYDCVKWFLIDEFNKVLGDLGVYDVKVLTTKERDILISENHPSLNGFAYDIVFQVGTSILPLEIKVSLSPDGAFQGSTHSTSKCENFLLIKVVIDRDVVVVEGNTFVNGVFAWLGSIDSEKWSGSHSDNNSRTSFKFNMFDSEGNKISHDSGVLCGVLCEARKFYKTVPQNY